MNKDELSDKEVEDIKALEDMNNKLLDMARGVKDVFVSAATESVKKLQAAQRYEKHKNI